MEYSGPLSVVLASSAEAYPVGIGALIEITAILAIAISVLSLVFEYPI
jgi:hypothetical protein